MKIDIFDLTSKKITNQIVELSLEIPELYDGYEYVSFSKPIILKGSLNLVGDIICLNAKLSTELIFSCSRCLEKFNYPLNIDINEQFSRNANNKDEEIILIEGDKLDLTNIIENNIFISLPMTRICGEDCKGLCQVCGTDLNKSTCTCKRENIDPRLEKLKDLFSTN